MSQTLREVWVFDSGPLSHFAEAGWLGLLELYTREAESWLPDVVANEVSNGVDRHPHLRQILDAPWLQRKVVGTAETTAFAHYASRLVVTPPTNTGECGVLALAEVHGAVAIIDDGAARRLAEERAVSYKTTVSVLCDLVNAGHLGLDTASAVADRLLSTEYRLPFSHGGFKIFALENDLITNPYG